MLCWKKKMKSSGYPNFSYSYFLLWCEYYKLVHFDNKMFLFSSLQGAGAALAYVGAYMIRSYGNFESFIQDKQTLIPAAIVIGISVVMFIFGLVGCCATLRESKFGLGCVSGINVYFFFFFFLLVLINITMFYNLDVLISSYFSLFSQFFLIIMIIFAAEVAALVFTFIYQGRVSQNNANSVMATSVWLFSI